MRKLNVAFWLVVGISTGTVSGVVLNNILTGISMGAGSGMLVMLLSVLKR